MVGPFVEMLRAHGIPVTVSEAIDAADAIVRVGAMDRERLRVVLRATVVKRHADYEGFDEVFQLFFATGASMTPTMPLAQLLMASGVANPIIERVLAHLGDYVTELSAAAQMGVGLRPLVVDDLVNRRLASEMDGLRSPLHVGYYAQRMCRALHVGDAESQVRQLLMRLRQDGGLSQADYDGLLAVVKANFITLRRAVRDHVQSEVERRTSVFVPPDDRLVDKPLATMSTQELTLLRAEVRRLARLLRSRFHRTARARRRGRLDLRRTLRSSMKTDAIPATLFRRYRPIRKPRIVVLCDISDSVRTVSRFMLQFVYALGECFDDIVSFAFVADLGELTALFANYDHDVAIDTASSGAIVSIAANSNYGRAFEQFRTRHLAKVTRRTSVIIIGDGRNNYHPPRAHILAEMRQRAQRVVWLNPEPPSSWDYGDSAMRAYEGHCDRVVFAYNLNSLRQVIDHLGRVP